MIEATAWKKLILFGVFGAAGCLIGWLVGEPFLMAAMPAAGKSGNSGSLVSRAAPPQPEQLSDDFRKRLENAGAHSGDVQLSLSWDNANDLDLHCSDPSNVNIFYRNKRSPTGGELDVDRNADCGNDPKPVENIFWPVGGAPTGRYQVFLDYFAHCPGAANETAYQISVLVGRERKLFSGTIREGQRRVPIHQFELKPLIEVFAPPQLEIAPGAKIMLPIAIRRSFYKGPATIELLNLPAGVTAPGLTIADGEENADLELRASADAKGSTQTVQIVATGGPAGGVAEIPMTVVAGKGFSWGLIFLIGIWTAILAVGLTVALLVSQNRYLGRPLFAGGKWPLAIGGSAAAGLVSGAIGQLLFNVLALVWLPSLGFLVGWVLLGGLLAGGVAYFVPNLDKRKATIAGAIGGFGGALAFLLVSLAADVAGRFVGAAILGFSIGLMVALAEAAFRSFWLEIYQGLEKRTVNLGAQPVTVGSDLRNCTIYARNSPKMVGSFQLRDGRAFWTDYETQASKEIAPGEERTIAGIKFMVRSANAAEAPRRAAPPPPPPPPPIRPTVAGPAGSTATATGAPASSIHSAPGTPPLGGRPLPPPGKPLPQGPNPPPSPPGGKPPLPPPAGGRPPLPPPGGKLPPPGSKPPPSPPR